MMKNLGSYVVVLLLVALIGTVSGANYVVVDLGAVVDTQPSKAEGICPNGGISGEAKNADGGYVPVYWAPGTYTMTAGSSVGSHTYGYDASDNGQVVGRGYTAASQKRAFVWDAVNDTVQLPFLPGGVSQTGAYGANTSMIVGYSSASTTILNSCYWTPDGSGGWNVTSLQPGDSRFSSARDVSQNGDIIVGWRNGGDGKPRAWYWKSNGAGYDGYYLDPGGSGKDVYALACNDSGEAAGYKYSGGTYQAALWNGMFSGGHAPGTETLPGTLGGVSSMARAINNDGVVVGWANTADGDKHAFIWDATNGMQDLNDLIAPTGWVLTEAGGINDDGLIVGYGTNPDGMTRGFVLVPEPISMALFGCAGLLALRRRKC